MGPGAPRRRRARRRTGPAWFAIAARLPGAAASCGPRFVPPVEAPINANRYNGIGLRACFNSSGRHHVFVIGDWGGQGNPPKPADRRGPAFPGTARVFVQGADDCAQERVARQMRKRAKESNPDYVLNAGDNFYWGGISTICGARPYSRVNTGQWGPIFEEMYRGPGLDGKQWLGVLGNHDYGGFSFSSGWDQAIGYTWGGPPPCTYRWMTPAQYWSARAEYPDFSVDYYFMDTNVFNAFEPHDNQDHNICSLQHNPAQATCGEEGPTSVWDCPLWFRRMWRDQTAWAHRLLSNSTADWQVVVTHFPPTFGQAGWERLVAQHGIDLIVSGHVHQQELHHMEAGNFLKPTAWLVSGGGGGITSEGVPDAKGADDQYGFFDLTFSKEEIWVQAISHGGQIRRTAKVLPRKPAGPLELNGSQGGKDIIVVEDRLRIDPEGRGHSYANRGSDVLGDGGSREVVGAGHDDGRAVLGGVASSPGLLAALYVALVALVASVGFASYRFFCRDRLRGFDIQKLFPTQEPCRYETKSSSGSNSRGYSTLVSTFTSRADHTKDVDERLAEEEAAGEVPDEYRRPEELGCFCWPTRIRGARYQRLQPV